MAVMNKRLLISESRGDSNQYTLCRGKLDQYDTYASPVSPRTLSVRFLRAVPVCGNLSRVTDRVGRILLLLRKMSLTPPLSPAEWPTRPTSVSLPRQSLKQ
jgi:hypothetical protein